MTNRRDVHMKRARLIVAVLILAPMFVLALPALAVDWAMAEISGANRL